jgi:hypothetical protein
MSDECIGECNFFLSVSSSTQHTVDFEVKLPICYMFLAGRGARSSVNLSVPCPASLRRTLYFVKWMSCNCLIVKIDNWVGIVVILCVCRHVMSLCY